MSNILAVHYHRPPDRINIFQQKIVYASDEVIVSLLESAKRAAPALIDGKVVLEDGSPIVWFIFAGARHDVGLFHTKDGMFTGYYADILEPVEIQSQTDVVLTDLFLDVWIDRADKASVLDADELDDAVAKGWVTRDTADTAWQEAKRLIALHAEGAWPPPIVNEWRLERVRSELRSSNI